MILRSESPRVAPYSLLALKLLDNFFRQWGVKVIRDSKFTRTQAKRAQFLRLICLNRFDCSHRFVNLHDFLEIIVDLRINETLSEHPDISGDADESAPVRLKTAPTGERRDYGTRSVPITINVYLFLEFTIVYQLATCVILLNLPFAAGLGGVISSNLRYPTEPSICSWIRRFISTAYSIGSSFTSGSMNPLTIMVEASSSDSPRLIR